MIPQQITLSADGTLRVAHTPKRNFLLIDAAVVLFFFFGREGARSGRRLSSRHNKILSFSSLSLFARGGCCGSFVFLLGRGEILWTFFFFSFFTPVVVNGKSPESGAWQMFRCTRHCVARQRRRCSRCTWNTGISFYFPYALVCVCVLYPSAVRFIFVGPNATRVQCNNGTYSELSRPVLSSPANQSPRFECFTVCARAAPPTPLDDIIFYACRSGRPAADTRSSEHLAPPGTAAVNCLDNNN